MGKILKKDASVIKEEKFNDLKESMPNKVKNNANKIINNRFPPFEQRNLSNEVKTEIRDRQTDNMVTQSEMNSLINDMIDASEQLENEIENAETLNELENIDISEQNLKQLAGW